MDMDMDIATAARMLTQIGTTPDGGIVVGPQGWSLLQAALAAESAPAAETHASKVAQLNQCMADLSAAVATVLDNHPNTLAGNYYRVAVDGQGNALYAFRDMRMGGKRYQLRRRDGTLREWTHYAMRRQRPEAPPNGGRWRWDTELKEMFS